MNVWLLAVLLAALLGCTVTWSKPGMTQEEFARDEYACQSEASRVAPTSHLHAVNQGAKDRLYLACMQARGYQKQ